MNYKKYTNNAFNLHIITTPNFKTNMIKINFKKRMDKIDITYRNLLTKVLMQSNAKHKTIKEIEIATEDLYNLSLNASNLLSGNYIITSFNSVFLNEKYTEEGMFEKSLEFILSTIFNPNVENGEFKYFDLAKRLVKDEIDTLKDDSKRYSQLRLLEEMDKGVLSYNPIGYMEDLEKITNKDLYLYYEELLKNSLIDIFIIGNIDSEKTKDYIYKNFKVNTLKKPGNGHYIIHEKINKRAKTVKEQMPLEQTKLCLGFKLDDLTDFEKKYVLNVYCFILGGGPDSKLFKNVREKNSLCYTIGCSYKPVSNIMVINAGINKDDSKKCINLIKKELIKMSKGDFSNTDIEAAIITYINSLKDIEDNLPSILKIFESHEYLNFDLIDERCLNIKNVTKEDIINLTKKIHLTTIYLLEGETNEEN